MSKSGYTTETFAIVYALFDAFFGRRPESGKKKSEPTHFRQKMFGNAYVVNFFVNSCTNYNIL